VEDRISGLEDKIHIKEGKNKEFLDIRLKPSKDKTYESQALKKEKRCKPKV
jgi:hypothetical protein